MNLLHIILSPSLTGFKEKTKKEDKKIKVNTCWFCSSKVYKFVSICDMCEDNLRNHKLCNRLSVK